MFDSVFILNQLFWFCFVSDFDSLLSSALLDDSVHSVFNEIANIRPTSSSSSDEDDKNLIVSWELNEKNLDTLPSSPSKTRVMFI